MIDLPTPHLLLGLPVHPVTMQQATLAIEAHLEARSASPLRHVALNATKAVAAGDDPALAAAIHRAELVTADGAGILLLGRRCGVRLPERVTGIDLMAAVSARAAWHGWPVYLLGGRPGIAEGAAASLKRQFRSLKIAGTHHGYFPPEEDGAIAARIRATGARILFVAMNTPRKEVFVDGWSGPAGVGFAMGVGGAFDVLCGRHRRAPLVVQSVGMEWAFRWAQEPQRLARRYGIGVPRFLVRVARNRAIEAPAGTQATRSAVA